MVIQKSGHETTENNDMRPNGDCDDGTVHTKCLNEMASLFVARLSFGGSSFWLLGGVQRYYLLNRMVSCVERRQWGESCIDPCRCQPIARLRQELLRENPAERERETESHARTISSARDNPS